MVSISRSMNDRANNYNYKYLNCYLETITRTISVSLVLIDVAMLIYDRLGTVHYIIISAHILSSLIYFISSFKPIGSFVLQFIVLSSIFVLYTIYNFAIALTLLIAEGYNLLLLRLSLNGCSTLLQLYALYISIIFYIRIRNDAYCDDSSFEDEIEETNVQLIIDNDDNDE